MKANLNESLLELTVRGVCRKILDALDRSNVIGDKKSLDTFLQDCAAYKHWLTRSIGVRIDFQTGWKHVEFPVLCFDGTCDRFVVFDRLADGTLLAVDENTNVTRLAPNERPTQWRILTVLMDQTALRSGMDDRTVIDHIRSLSLHSMTSSTDVTPAELNTQGKVMLESTGLVTIRGAFDQHLIERIRETCDELVAIERDKRAGVAVGTKRRLFTMTLKGALLETELYAQPEIYRFLGTQLGDGFILNSAILVRARKGSTFQRLHADHPALFGNTCGEFDLPYYGLVVAIPLNNLDFNSGTTRFVCKPKPHTLKDALDVFRLGSKALLAAPGDAAIYDYRVFHQGMPTLSDVRRDLFLLTYTRPWFQETTPYRALIRTKISATDLASVPGELTHLFSQRESC